MGRYCFYTCLSVHRGQRGAVMSLPGIENTPLQTALPSPSPPQDSTSFPRTAHSTCPPQRQDLPPKTAPPLQDGTPPPVNKQAVCILLECFLVCCHRPQTEVCEGYVFTGVCLSTGEGLCSRGSLSRGLCVAVGRGDLCQGPVRFRAGGTHLSLMHSCYS